MQQKGGQQGYNSRTNNPEGDYRRGHGGAFGIHNFVTRGYYNQNKLPDTYICDRCKQPGHHIRDCPENGNAYFDPCQNRGVPKQHIWKMQLKLNDEFQRNAGNVVKSLLKQNEIYTIDE